MKNPAIAAADARLWRAVVAGDHAGEFTADGQFQRTLWHEIGHYLGVDRDRQGRPLDVGLEEYSDALEEMKADLVSLFAGRAPACGWTPDARRAPGGPGLGDPPRDPEQQAVPGPAVPDDAARAVQLLCRQRAARPGRQVQAGPLR